MDLSFEKLLSKALSEWPDDIAFGDLANYHEDTGRYYVEGIENDNADAYIGKDNEIIMRTLHDAVYATFHSAAKYLTAVKKNQLRHQTIREQFETKLLKNMSSSDLNWRDKDYDLAKKYFDANRQSST